MEVVLKDLAASLPELSPSIAALALASLVVLVSNSFPGYKRVHFQCVVFALALSFSVSVLLAEKESLRALWTAFTKLTDNTKLALSALLITSTFFGGAFYVPTVVVDPQSIGGDLSKTPASCDSVVDFDVPANLPADDKELFLHCFDRFVHEIIADLPTLYEMPAEAVQWTERMINYTVAGGKMNRGLAVMDVQKILARAKGKSLSNKERLQSAALGWCVEFLQAFFLVADDVMDDSVTRRGNPCWFRRDEVKLIAINDSFILESCVYKILKRYFGNEEYYIQLVDLFLEVTRQTELGQLLDLTSQPQGEVIDLERFTLERYSSIVKYKTAFYSFYLPVALGMIVSGVRSPTLYIRAKEILCIMGEYFQIQDDYLDCYGSPEVIGKVGTDIQDNKCGWLVVQALRRATPKQRKVLEKNYGRHDAKSVDTVKALYQEMDIESFYKEYEEESYAEIQRMLADEKDLPKEVFEFLLKKIYKRSK